VASGHLGIPTSAPLAFRQLSDQHVDCLREDLGEPVARMDNRTRAGLAAIRPVSGGQTTEEKMQIQINTNSHVAGREKLAVDVRSVVESALSRFGDQITRVEVHISDQNSSKSGPDDKRCVMEARLEGRQPTAATHYAATVDQAVAGAADKLTRLIESTLGRLHDQNSRRTDPAPPGSKPTEQS
jgi:hypothetical protein